MKKLIFVFTAIISAFIATSCISAKKEVPLDASSLEIVQMAQSAYDSGDTDGALYYYNVLLQRYGMDTASYIEGRYEIAHIYIKQKKYNLAKPILEEILEIYNSTQPGMLPGAFRKLALNDLAKIPEPKS